MDEEFDDEYVRHCVAWNDRFDEFVEEDAERFDRWLAKHDEEIRQGLLPEGAKYFPDEGGIMYKGNVYYPADYVLTRRDIEQIRKVEDERIIKLLEEKLDEYIEAYQSVGEPYANVVFAGIKKIIEGKEDNERF